jgi:hypothetical protein
MIDISSLPDFKLSSTTRDESPCEPGQGKITLHTTSSWTYCGTLLPLSEPHLPALYHSWHRATVHGSLTSSLLSFLSFAHKLLKDAGIQHYWLTVRATKPNHDYDIPRWHTDEDFFGQNGKALRTQWKLATTLLGPGTLFMEDGMNARAVQKSVKGTAQEEGNHICASFKCLGCASVTNTIRARLAEELKDYTVVQASATECCFFRIGEERGAVHSEPPQNCDRVFINIVPGTEAELSDLMAKWGMEFPRAWSFGVPFNFR